MSFTLDVSKFANDAIKVTEQDIKASAIALFASIIMDTPVGEKYGGTARGGWFASSTKPSIKVGTKIDPSGTASISAMQAKVSALKDAQIIQLTNNLPYIDVLENGGYPNPSLTGTLTTNGYSKKAPNGMVKKNIIRLEEILAKEARKRNK